MLEFISLENSETSFVVSDVVTEEATEETSEIFESTVVDGSSVSDSGSSVALLSIFLAPLLIIIFLITVILVLSLKKK